MLRYFPFDRDQYEMTMNARAGVDALIEVDDELYLDEIGEKAEILESDPDYYYRCPSSFEKYAWDCIELLLPNMAQNYPQHFSLDTDGSRWHWTNSLLESQDYFVLGDPSTLPRPPLDWLGRQVQEDLILMQQDGDSEAVCVGGHLCFPSFWSLDDKMHKNFLDIHREVPSFLELIGQPSDLMMRRLKVGRPTMRLNWTIGTSDKLNMASRFNHHVASTRNGITLKNAGYRCFLRVERQTFSRLPRSGGILFTIHTYINPIEEIAADAARLIRFTSVVKGLPEETRRYKGMTSYYGAFIEYLDHQIELCGG